MQQSLVAAAHGNVLSRCLCRHCLGRATRRVRIQRCMFVVAQHGHDRMYPQLRAASRGLCGPIRLGFGGVEFKFKVSFCRGTEKSTEKSRFLASEAFSALR